MRSPDADRRAARERGGALALLILADVILIGYLAGVVAPAVALISIVAPLALALFRRDTRAPPGGLVAGALAMTATGVLGMLLGLAIDAGPFGVLGVIALCNAPPLFAPGVDALLRHLHYMPAAFIGMLAGNMLLSPVRGPDRDISPAPAARCGWHVLATLGMLWGMLYAERVSHGLFTTSHASLRITATLAAMALGMFVGTVAAAWLVAAIRRSAKRSRAAGDSVTNAVAPRAGR